jgi:hypothetical protein
MTRTRKDSNQATIPVVEVIKRPDGAFGLYLNRRERVTESGLRGELRVRFGYCGEECEHLLRELNQNGRAKLTF